MDAATLVRVLERTVSPDTAELNAAQKYLEQASQVNVLEFIKILSDVLANRSNSEVARVAAGLQLKNALTAKDSALKEKYQQRWMCFPEDIRNYVKANVFNALGTETSRPSSGAQCVAYIAIIELPIGQWPNVIHSLCTNIFGENRSEMLKESSLEALGYICQEVNHDCLVPCSNMILTAIMRAMRKEEQSQFVRLAATNALYNSLEFTRANFDKEAERNYIMEVVCESTQAPTVPEKVAALQCLVKIMSLYYDYMEPYMGQALFNITLKAMESDIDEIALQGIEFWSNVSEVEIDLSIEYTEAAELGQPPERTSKFYAKLALQFLVPVLIQKLTQQEEYDDEDEWNPNKAAGVCLMLLSSCCVGAISPYVLPFVRENIKHDDWKYRDAALMAFGCVLSGIKPPTLNILILNMLPTIIELMYDQNAVVRDTAVWTVGRICEITPESAINPIYLKPLLEALVHGLKSEPRVASNACWAFVGLSEACYEAAGAKDNEQPNTYCLSEYFDYLVEKLLETTERVDGSQANLRTAAYEALMEMIKNSPRDCYVTVQKTTLLVLNKLDHLLQLESHIQNTSDKAQVIDMQGLLCATLQSVLRKVTPEDAPQISDQVMTALLRMLHTGSEKSGDVQEDALLAVSTLVEVLGEKFKVYMEAFKPFLYIGLKNHVQQRVCSSAVGVVGDICRALNEDVLPYCDDIMTILVHNLGDSSVNKILKPQIISLFGDIAMAIGPKFNKYLDVAMTILMQASSLQVDKNDYDMVEYVNDLRESILEAYAGVIQGLKGDNPNAPNPEVAFLEPKIEYMTQFLKSIALDEQRSDRCVASAAGLIGDLCTTFGPKALAAMDKPATKEILTIGRQSKVSKTKNSAQWAVKELKKVMKQQASS